MPSIHVLLEVACPLTAFDTPLVISASLILNISLKSCEFTLNLMYTATLFSIFQIKMLNLNFFALAMRYLALLEKAGSSVEKLIDAWKADRQVSCIM